MYERFHDCQTKILVWPTEILWREASEAAIQLWCKLEGSDVWHLSKAKQSHTYKPHQAAAALKVRRCCFSSDFWWACCLSKKVGVSLRTFCSPGPPVPFNIKINVHWVILMARCQPDAICLTSRCTDKVNVMQATTCTIDAKGMYNISASCYAWCWVVADHNTDIPHTTVAFHRCQS